MPVIVEARWETWLMGEEGEYTHELQREDHAPHGCKRFFRFKGSKNGRAIAVSNKTTKRHETIETARRWCQLFRLDTTWLDRGR